MEGWGQGVELVTPGNSMVYSSGFEVPQLEPTLYET